MSELWGGVVRPLNDAYCMIKGTKRRFYPPSYRIVMSKGGDEYYNVSYNSCTLDISNGVATIATDINSGSGSNKVKIVILGELANKSVSFDYTGSGYSAMYACIEYIEFDSSYSRLYTTQLLYNSSSISVISKSKCARIELSIWNDAAGGARTTSVKFTNFKIDGESIF